VEEITMQSEHLSLGEENGNKSAFPIRLRPDALKRIFHKILTKSEGERDGWARTAHILDTVEEAQVEKLSRPLEAEEKRTLQLVTLRDARLALLGLASGLKADGSPSDTHLRRGKNAPYLLWRVEKEILLLHWRIEMLELEDRQRQSGLRMRAFLEESFKAEGF
jgi:hypothetical protein